MVAYQPGKAAKMPAAATMSHTSLASQNGPIVLMATRRSRSVRPTKEWSAPTPRSKPSRMKKPVQKVATTMYQKICSPISHLSVRQDRDTVGFFLWLTGGGFLRFFAERLPAVVDHQHAVGRRQ